MKIWRIGSRWSDDGNPNTEILDVFLKMGLIFIGNRFKDNFLKKVKKGDYFVVTSGLIVKAIAIADSDAFNLYDMEFNDVDECLSSDTYEDFDFEDASSYAVGCYAKIFKLQKSDIFSINRGLTFSRFREKDESEIKKLFIRYRHSLQGESLMPNEHIDQYKNLLQNTHNLILHGAPGTGKTHLAQEIAQAMGAEVGFVQFHPSYDYTDFVEGLRPVNDAGSGQIGFDRKDGVFKKFCERALKSLSDNLKSVEPLQKEKIEQLDIINNQSDDFFSAYEYVLSIINPNTIKVFGNVNYSVEGQQLKFHTENLIRNVQKDKLQQLFEALKDKPNDIDNYGNREKQTELLGCTVDYSYYKPILKEMLSYHFENTKNLPNDKNKISYNTNNTPFVFIIDEINRGEMSKIFGELFFAIDPSYRGAKKCRDLRTQYANLQTIPNLFDVALGIKDSDNFGHFFIPENVYIIGTMNDIDRGVESMDFAFRRRFTFKEIKAKDTQEQILAGLDESIKDKAIHRMDSLNGAISKIEGLSSAYHIGGAYFLKLKELAGDFGKLWEYHLEGLLREYLRGMEDADDELEKLKAAYNLENSDALQG